MVLSRALDARPIAGGVGAGVSDALGGALGVAAAALGGLAVGIERQRSGHASGPAGRFAGMRTFTLLGGPAGASGWLWSGGQAVPGAILLGAGAALVIAAYAAGSRRDVEATTEVAGLVVLAAGFLAGVGQLALASGMVALTVLMLLEKSRLHAWAARLNDAEVRAAARFAVMAVVVLPLLPEGPMARSAAYGRASCGPWCCSSPASASPATSPDDCRRSRPPQSGHANTRRSRSAQAT